MLFRGFIRAKIKLEVTLSFLGTGDSYISLSHMYRMPKSSISKIISEVCQEIKTALKDHIKIRYESLISTYIYVCVNMISTYSWSLLIIVNESLVACVSVVDVGLSTGAIRVYVVSIPQIM